MSKEDKADQTAPTDIILKPGEDIEARKCYADAMSLLAYATSRVIKTTDDLKTATEDLSIIAKLKKLMVEKRKGYLAPLKEKSDAIRDTYEYLMAPILGAEQLTKTKMLAYDAEQDRIRRTQEEINRKRMEAAEAEMELNGELSESVNVVEVVPAAPKNIRTDLGMSTRKASWKYEVTDFALLPDEYKVADKAMLSTVAKSHHDKKPIPGVRFYNEPIISTRAR